MLFIICFRGFRGRDSYRA